MNIALFLTALAVLVGALSSIFSTTSILVRCGYIAAAVISVCALYLQVRASRPYIVDILQSDWDKKGDEAKYVIPQIDHQKGLHPSVKLSRLDEETGNYIEGLFSPEVKSNGDVIVSIHSAATGQFRVTVS